MEKYLVDLLERMLDKSDRDVTPFDSSKTISWKALREAEQINDGSYVTQLISFIDQEKDKEKRDRAYFILGHLAKNTKSEETTAYLISRIRHEKDKSVLCSLLGRIQYLEKSLDMDITPIFEVLKAKDWQVRHSAIHALKGAKNKSAEQSLLTMLAETEDAFDLWYINTTLAEIGTGDSIPYLLKLIDHKKQDVSGTALTAILAISDQTELPLFIEQLQKGKNKFTALLGVIKYGDQSHIPHVVQRLKELVSKKRNIEVIAEQGKTEVIFAMEFLSKFSAESTEPQKMFTLLRDKKQALLWDKEKEWLEQNQHLF